jgi:hypothetical protein
MAKLYNLARMTTATTGTGTITLGSAVSGYLTFALAGVVNGEIVSYGIKDGANSETGTGTYTSAGTTLTRSVTKSTNADAAINLSGSAEVFITARAQDLLAFSADQTFTAAEKTQARKNLDAALKGHIYGLTLSNNAIDITNDIDIAAGEAASTESNPVLMVLAAALTKRLDASWVVGTNQGMLDGSEAVAGTPDVSTWYYIWLIRRSDTGVVDVLASESASSPTMPASYDQKRRIGAVYNDSAGNIRAFTQLGDAFWWNTPIQDVSTTTLSTARSLFTMTTSCPPSMAVGFRIVATSATNDIHILLQPVAETDAAPSASASPGISITITVGTRQISGQYELPVDASANIAARATAASTTVRINPIYYIDRRGQDR